MVANKEEFREILKIIQSQFYEYLVHSTELKHFAYKTKGIDLDNLPRFPISEAFAWDRS